MLRKIVSLCVILSLFVVSSVAFAQEPVEIRIMADLVDAQVTVYNDIIADFEAANPDIDVVLDVVPYDTITQTLPLQLETGVGPDIIKSTDVTSLAPYYLDMRPYLPDADYWDANFGPTIAVTNIPGSGNTALSAIYSDVTVTGAFINRTLFEQAGVPVPSDSGEPVTWEEWEAAAVAVRDATGVDFAMGLDRSGHRLMGPAISIGATYLNEEGYPDLANDAGFRAFAELFVGFHERGSMPADIWAGGDGARNGRDEFINGNLVFYYSGNWQIGSFAENIGDAFDWEAVPAPCGAQTCTGMPGGAVFAAIAATQHPEEVSRFMDYFASEPVYREWAERTLLAPQHTALVAAGLNWDTELPQALKSLDVFAVEAGNISPIALALFSSPNVGPVYGATRDRLTQVIVGELTLDEAMERIQTDIDTGLAAVTGG
ncbi:MAG: carbohydrate ABC transporter substrate-binding protein [Chloroflexi bacterium]|nr:carbohydrate ABC transporter substrate-binding protein [Chloroflexota bacterium]